VAILATSGAERQPPHTDIAHQDRELKGVGLHNRLAFAAIKNIHDEGVKSGTIIIEDTNATWTSHGFDKDSMLRQGGLATRILGHHTMTTYIDHKTIHFGDEVPQKKANDWKLTIYVLFIQTAVLKRFSKAHDKTLLHTSFQGHKIETIKDENEYIVYTLNSENWKQQRTEVTARTSTKFKEIRRRIAT
jgi:hypothetical protein